MFFFFYFLPHVRANLCRLLQKLEELEKEEELREAAGLYDSEPVSDGQIYNYRYSLSGYSLSGYLVKHFSTVITVSL